MQLPIIIESSQFASAKVNHRISLQSQEFNLFSIRCWPVFHANWNCDNIGKYFLDGICISNTITITYIRGNFYLILFLYDFIRYFSIKYY